jgi:hypothetical protein
MPLNVAKLKERLAKFETKPKPKRKKPEPKRMSYYTYAYLKALIDKEKVKLERDYQRALTFIPSEPFNPKLEGRTARDKAHRIFSDEWAKFNELTEELHLAAQSMYKDHPRQEMREFWGLK